MKYAVILYDGMADLPVEELGNKTPMQAADKPNFDRLATKGEIGLVRTVAEGLKPGSDVANLSVLGYDPAKYYTGRSPLEAVSIGVKMLDDDIALRCNLVSLSDEEKYCDKTMVDYSGGDISTPEAAEIIKSVEEHFGNDIFKFYSGVQYRHCLIWHKGTVDLGNIRRMAEGKLPANSIWLWGEGKKPMLSSFEETYGLKGSIISAVDLLKGIGQCAGMKTPDVPGSTGYIDTNFEGKAKQAVEDFDSGCDFVYIHFEAPDECGHRREAKNKVRSIELIDEKVLPVIIEGLEKYDDYKIMILPDHPTPIKTATHSSEPVPYMIYHKKAEKENTFNSINEETAKQSGNFVDFGPDLIRKFLEK